MKQNTKTAVKPAVETRDHVENPWNYEDETRKIYTGEEMAELVRRSEDSATEITVADFVRTFLSFNHDPKAAIDVFAAAASFRYTVTPDKDLQ